tara:strand:- start:218 stop:883 length:666 start_codon:yes stop_codon:yes gene_type:complete
MELSEDIVKVFNDIVDYNKKNKTEKDFDYNAISQSKLEEKKVMPIIESVTKKYIEQGYANIGKHEFLDLIDIQVKMQSTWFVSQQEHEYNPMHHHENCQVCGIIYLKIPEYKSREVPGKGTWNTFSNQDGDVQFSYCSEPDIFTIGNLALKPKVGDVILFPSILKHHVYPFLGSGERRSVSINMTYKSTKKDSGVAVGGDSVNLHNETYHPETIPWRNLDK